MEGLNRAALGLTNDPNEGKPFYDLVRFLSFLLILAAIAYKNLTEGARAKPTKTKNIP